MSRNEGHMSSQTEVAGVDADPSVEESGSCSDLLKLAAFVCGASNAVIRKPHEAPPPVDQGLHPCAELPLTLAGHPLGTLIVFDDIPRALTSQQMDALQIVAREMAAHFEHDLRNRRLALAAAAGCRTAEGGSCEVESRSRAFIDHSPAVAFMKDCYGRYVYVNKILCERFGRSEEEWLGRTDFDLFPHDTAEAFWETDCRILSGERNVSVMEAL